MQSVIDIYAFLQEYMMQKSNIIFTNLRFKFAIKLTCANIISIGNQT